MIPPIANNFVAGETVSDALDRANALEASGITAILNRLGEHYDESSSAEQATNANEALIGDIADRDLDACISVKPSQLGLTIDEELFRANLHHLLQTADGDVFVWLDMEDHRTTDATLEAYIDYVEEFPELGVCLQANLRRTSDDLARVANTPGKLRLVKGAYNEPLAIAHPNKSAIDEAYRQLITDGIADARARIAVATHDDEMIDHAAVTAARHDTDFEIQMLMGVREDYQQRLATEYDVYQYVPYGPEWFSYFYRRVRERKENLRFAVRAILGR